MPWHAKYDYVEAYDYDVNTDTFTLRFRDDFDFLDESIWKVSHNAGFEQNSSRFMWTHTYVTEGQLVLEMDKRLRTSRPENLPDTREPEDE